MLRQIGAAMTTANMKSTGPKRGCAVLNAPRGSWFHRHKAKNDKLESAIAQVNARGGRSLSFVMHGMLNGCPGSGHDAVDVDLDAVEP
jgi:hypothetical protein